MSTVWTLQAIRFIRRIRRKLFGKTLPHYVKGLVKVVKIVNFFQLIPTIHMIAFGPSHFFKSIPAILNEKKPYYVTPIPFLTSLATFQLAILQLFHLPTVKLPDQLVLSAYCVLLAILSPVIVVLACLLILFFWFGWRSLWPLKYIIPEDGLNVDAVLVPLDPLTYGKLSPGRFFWSLFYYYLYLYPAFLFFALLIGGEILVASLHVGHQIPSSVARYLSFGIGIVLVFPAYWLIVRPYIFLLVHSSSRVTDRMRKAAVHSGYVWVLERFARQRNLP